MVAIKFCKRDFCQYRAICVALKQMRAELLDIKSRCTVVDTVQDYSTGFPRTIKIEGLLQDKYLKQSAVTEAGILELEQWKDIIYRTITLACGAVDMRMYNNVFLYIIRGLSADQIAIQNTCDRSTVYRDIDRFFKEGKKFFVAVVGGSERVKEQTCDKCDKK